MVDVDAAADGCGDGREIAFVGADDEVVAAQGTFDDAGVDDVGGAGAADQGSGGPGVVESFGTARRQSLKLIHHLADGQAGARSPGRTAIQTGAAEPVRHGELYGIAPKWCERVTGVKDHSLAVQRFSNALTPADCSPHAAVRTGRTGYTFDAGGLRPRVRESPLVRRPGSRPADTGWRCSPVWRIVPGKTGAMPRPGLRCAGAARRCRGWFLAHV